MQTQYDRLKDLFDQGKLSTENVPVHRGRNATVWPIYNRETGQENEYKRNLFFDYPSLLAAFFVDGLNVPGTFNVAVFLRFGLVLAAYLLGFQSDIGRSEISRLLGEIKVYLDQVDPGQDRLKMDGEGNFTFTV